MATLAGGGDQHWPSGLDRIKQSTVTRLLDRMALKGQVERLPHNSDQRTTPVQIAGAGERTLKPLMELTREPEQRVLGPFSTRER